MTTVLLLLCAYAHDVPEEPARAARPIREHPVSIGLFTGFRPAVTSKLDGRTRPVRVGLGALLDWQVGSVLHLEATASLLPAVGHNLNRTTYDLPSEPIDRTGPDMLITAMPVFSPLRGRLTRPADAEIGLDVGFGLGMVHTVDDLEGLQAVQDPVAQATAVQWHPTLAWTVGPRVGLGKAWQARLRLRGAAWIEVFEGVALEQQHYVDLGLGIARAL